jgi:hypothetical protein
MLCPVLLLILFSGQRTRGEEGGQSIHLSTYPPTLSGVAQQTVDNLLCFACLPALTFP